MKHTQVIVILSTIALNACCPAPHPILGFVAVVQHNGINLLDSTITNNDFEVYTNTDNLKLPVYEAKITKNANQTPLLWVNDGKLFKKETYFIHWKNTNDTDTLLIEGALTGSPCKYWHFAQVIFNGKNCNKNNGNQSQEFILEK